jgi:hypothetical protein
MVTRHINRRVFLLVCYLMPGPATGIVASLIAFGTEEQLS